MEKNQGVNEGGRKSLEGYFNNLAAAAVNEKSVLEQLVVNNTKLASTNKDLVAIVKKMINDINNLEREISRLKKTGGKGKRDPTLCPHCKKEGYHAVEACFELKKKKTSAPLVRKDCCDGVGQ